MSGPVHPGYAARDIRNLRKRADSGKDTKSIPDTQAIPSRMTARQYQAFLSSGQVPPAEAAQQ